VHFTVKRPGSINKRTFVAELAPLTWLPATVNNFLQQVHQGLWDRTAFHVNAKHVIMAHPFETVPKRHLFDEKGLAEFSFLEYSKEFPHSKYTVGLNGNPIGPDFYINKMDNSEIHGHGGHQLGGYAEPCFAKIILGWEVIDDMAHLQGSMVLEGLLDEPIQILRAKVLTSLEKL
jgi:cyclophilin family peptidyl-prolyl cis-trans isomerase